MKTLSLTLILVGILSLQTTAADGNKGSKNRNALKVAVEQKFQLNPREEQLFKDGRLGETLVKPIYSTPDQLIYTAMVRNLKAAN